MQNLDDNMKRFINMLTYCRPDRSTAEGKFIDRYIKPVISKHEHWTDSYGNIYCQVGISNRVLFSGHTDTVHNKDCRNQSVQYDPVRQEVFQTEQNCLGADNTAGVWIMLNLIEHQIEGLYIFHRAEESGGLGSGYIAANYHSTYLKGVEIAIAFDRKGQTSIITHQMGSRTASDAFCEDFGVALGGMYLNDPTGSFTDTENYSDFIPECTNVSVGFENAHTKDEYVSTEYLDTLLTRLLCVDWDGLKAYRDPSIQEPADMYQQEYYGVYELAYDEVADIVANEPELAVAMLMDCKVDEDDYYAAMETVQHRGY